MPTSNITAFNENVQLDTVYYIVSERYPYHLAISEAAGPGYAHRMGWTPVPLSQAQSVISHPHVIDNWLSDSDLPAVQNLLRNNPSTPIFLKVVDPF